MPCGSQANHPCVCKYCNPCVAYTSKEIIVHFPWQYTFYTVWLLPTFSKYFYILLNVYLLLVIKVNIHIFLFVFENTSVVWMCFFFIYLLSYLCMRVMLVYRVVTLCALYLSVFEVCTSVCAHILGSPNKNDHSPEREEDTHAHTNTHTFPSSSSSPESGGKESIVFQITLRSLLCLEISHSLLAPLLEFLQHPLEPWKGQILSWGLCLLRGPLWVWRSWLMLLQ